MELDTIAKVKPLTIRSATPIPKDLTYPKLPTKLVPKLDPQRDIRCPERKKIGTITSWDGPLYVRALDYHKPRVYPDMAVPGETEEEKRWRLCQRPRWLPLQQVEPTNFETIIKETLPTGGWFTPDGGYWTPDGLLIPGDVRQGMMRLRARYATLKYQVRVPEPTKN